MFLSSPTPLSSILHYTPLLLILTILLFALRTRYKPVLRGIPGPFLCSVTNLHRLYLSWTRRAHVHHQHLHKKYGPLVRLGPNMISVGSPAMVPVIYGLKSNFQKSDFYPVLMPFTNGRLMPGLFNTTSNDLHKSMKRPIAGLYSLSNVVRYEPLVDKTIAAFFTELDSAMARDGKVDIGEWVQWFAFDVMGELTFSRRLGFLEQRRDIGGAIAGVWKKFEYAAVIGQMPWIDVFWDKNPIKGLFSSPTAEIVKFAIENTKERIQRGEAKKDFLAGFLEAKEKFPSQPDWYLTAWTTSNMLAGSDTTAILLRALIYHLLHSPPSLARLRAELPEGEISFSDAQKLPYFDACVKEAGRIHPAIGLPLERVVPAGGAEISGTWFPEGTVVGINAWVSHYDTEVYGEDAGVWRPERWLEADEEKRKTMERGLLTFGSGHRTCIGKNISLLEIYKLIPRLFRDYEMEFVEPGLKWRQRNSWLVKQEGLEVRLRRNVA